MGLFFIIGLILIAIVCGLTYSLYWIPKKLGYPIIGKCLSILVGLFFCVITFMTVFEDQLFTKNDVKKLLGEQNIHLLDNFEILKNESSSAIGDYYHTFILGVSATDKARIISEIRSSKNFHFDKETDTYSDNREDYYNGPKRIKNYETETQFIRELFEPQGNGYAPTWRKIKIEKQSDKITFEDIDE